jgi:excisionase family DNA binding protein
MEMRETKVKMLSAKELAAILGSRPLAYRLLNTQGFPVVRLGKRLLVREDSLDAWLKENEGQYVDMTPIT